MLKRESSLSSPWEGSKSLLNEKEADHLLLPKELQAPPL